MSFERNLNNPLLIDHADPAEGNRSVHPDLTNLDLSAYDNVYVIGDIHGDAFLLLDFFLVQI